MFYFILISCSDLLLVCAGEPDLPVLAAHRRPSQVWGSAADDAALPASAQDLQAGPPDEEGGAGGSQGLQGDLPSKMCHRICQVKCSTNFGDFIDQLFFSECLLSHVETLEYLTHSCTLDVLEGFA